jgi:hypothetical protein
MRSITAVVMYSSRSRAPARNVSSSLIHGCTFIPYSLYVWRRATPHESPLCLPQRKRKRRTPFSYGPSTLRKEGPFIYHLLQQVSSRNQLYSSQTSQICFASCSINPVLPDSPADIPPLSHLCTGSGNTILAWRAFIYPICTLAANGPLFGTQRGISPVAGISG